MADFDHMYDKSLIMDRIENAVGTLANTVFATARELLTSTGTWFVGKGSYPFDDPPAITTRTDLLDLSCGRRLDEDPISCHGA
jgi:hypothetical protein